MQTTEPTPAVPESVESAEPRREPEPGATEVSPRRRRLIKSGAFVPPVILTLGSSGSAAAASLGVCIPAGQEQARQRAVSDPVGFELAEGEDEFVRTPLVIRQARRVRKVNGKWYFKGPRAFPVYKRQDRKGREWLSFRKSSAGRRGQFVPSGRQIEVMDDSGVVVAVGDLVYLNGNRMRRFVALHEGETIRNALVAAGEAGILPSDEPGSPPAVGDLVDPDTGNLQAAVMTASCWASLNPSSEI